MAVTARNISTLEQYEFTCAQWGLMEPSNQAEWEVIENTCGFVSILGNPYAASEFLYTLDGRVAVADPLQINTVSGVSTIDFIDQQQKKVFAGPITGADDYPTFRLLELSDLPAGVGTVTSVAATAPAAGFTISGSPITSAGTLTFALADDLAALEGMVGTGIVARTAANTYAQRTITAGTGISLSNADGVSGNPTITNSAPDQTVVLTAGSNVTITGTYPNFTIAATGGGGGLVDGDYTDITVSGTGTVMTIDNDVVTFAKMQNVSTAILLGRITTGTGDVEEVSLNGTLEFSGITLRRAALTGDVTAPAGSNSTTIANNAVTTAKIADDAVTYAKIQNVTATNRVLGRITAGAGNVEELTQANLYTLLGMTGVANRIAIWSGANILSSDVAFGVDTVNDRMSVLSSNPGIGEGIAAFNIGTSGVLTGAKSLFAAVGSTNGNILGEFRNKNTGADANTIFQIGQAFGTGDAILQMSITGAGGVTYSAGVDKSDGLKFKITPDATAPGATANSGFIMTKDVIAKFGFNVDDPGRDVDMAGVARSKQWVNVAANPTVGAAGNGLGTGGAINTISGCNNGFYITFTCGDAPVNNGDLFTVTLLSSFNVEHYPVFVHGNAATANEFSKFVFDGFAPGTIKMKANGTLTVGKAYRLHFLTIGQ